MAKWELKEAPKAGRSLRKGYASGKHTGSAVFRTKEGCKSYILRNINSRMYSVLQLVTRGDKPEFNTIRKFILEAIREKLRRDYPLEKDAFP